MLLSDFGLSKSVKSGSRERLQSVVGTPEYVAPEVILKQGHGVEVRLMIMFHIAEDHIVTTIL